MSILGVSDRCIYILKAIPLLIVVSGFFFKIYFLVDCWCSFNFLLWLIVGFPVIHNAYAFWLDQNMYFSGPGGYYDEAGGFLQQLGRLIYCVVGVLLYASLAFSKKELVC